MKAHVIENNKIINTIVVDSLDVFPNLIDGSVGGIGWEYINGVFWPPAPFSSWVKGEVVENVGSWVSPVPFPEDTTKQWYWDENSISWVEA